MQLFEKPVNSCVFFQKLECILTCEPRAHSSGVKALIFSNTEVQLQASSREKKDNLASWVPKCSSYPLKGTLLFVY